VHEEFDFRTTRSWHEIIGLKTSHEAHVSRTVELKEADTRNLVLEQLVAGTRSLVL